MLNLAIRTAHVLGISSSFFLSGFSFAASYYTLPALAHSPVPARVKGWLEVYDLGKLVAPPVSAASALVWSYLAYASYAKNFGMWQGYAAAGILTLTSLPWTLVVMMSTNNALMAAAKKADEDSIKPESYPELEKMIGTWGKMNWVRTVTPMAGGIIGLLAFLPKW